MEFLIIDHCVPCRVMCFAMCFARKPNTMTNRSFSMYRNASDIWFLRGMLDANVREWFLSRGLLMSMSRTYCTACALWFMIHSEYTHNGVKKFCNWYLESCVCFYQRRHKCHGGLQTRETRPGHFYVSMSRTYCTAWVPWFMTHSEYMHNGVQKIESGNSWNPALV